MMWTFLGFIAFIISAVALIRGKLPALKIHNRTVAAIILSLSLIVMMVSVPAAPANKIQGTQEEAALIETAAGDTDRQDVAGREQQQQPDAETKAGLLEKAGPGGNGGLIEEDGSSPGSSPNPVQPPAGQLAVHFIDVGQGDSILIEAPGSITLIDGGPRSAGQVVVDYLRKAGITSINLLISTHPHEDHIGGLINVLETFPVKEVVDPAVVHTTKTFEDYLTLIDQKDIKFTEGRAGMTRDLGSGANLQILHPSSPSSSDLNNASIVTRLTFGDISFLLSGDAESAAESQILNRSGEALASTVLKVGHHGSSAGTTQAYIDTVKPKAAVIMCGKGNSYGHPHEETLAKLAGSKTDIYRTDEQGTIVIQTDGQILNVNTQPYQHTPQKVPEKITGEEDPGPEPASVAEQESATAQGEYVGSKTSDKYHHPSCKYVSQIKPENRVWFDSVESAMAAGYVGCKTCNPPGTTIEEPEPEPGPASKQEKDITVYVTKSGKKYHTSGCRHLSKSKIPMSLSDAKASGHTPCSVCNPPR